MLTNPQTCRAWVLAGALLFSSVPATMAASDNDVATFEQSNNCVECDLSDADLSTAMNRANQVKKLTDTNFENAVFTDSDIQQADFDCANLANAKLDGIRSRHPNFNKADLNGANLTNAVLDTPNFFLADLSDADLTGVTWGAGTEEDALAGAKLCNTTMPDGISIDNSGCDAGPLNRRWCVTTWR